MTPRYQVRFTNGFYKSFDTRSFADVEKHATKAEAIKAVATLNKRR